MSEQTALAHGIINPNSSGQGLHPDYDKHPLHSILAEYLFEYTHSVVVSYRTLTGEGTLVHCYRNKTHSISAFKHPFHKSWQWDASRNGHARVTQGSVATLRKFILNVLRRERYKAKHGK